MFARFANTPSDRDAMALERKSLKMQSVMFEMMKRDWILDLTFKSSFFLFG